MTLEKSGNTEAIKQWIAKWEPLSEKAIDAYCAAMPEVLNAAAEAKSATRDFRCSLML